MIEQPPFSEWLEQKYLEYQIEQSRRVTLGEFAEALGISQGLLSHYLKGIRKPRISTVHKLAEVLGPELYTILGYQRPDVRLQYISANWDKLSQEEQDNLIEHMKSQVAEHQGEPNAETA
jgi:transcriptional regulator with XRE-family HTH domain